MNAPVYLLFYRWLQERIRRICHLNEQLDNENRESMSLISKIRSAKMVDAPGIKSLKYLLPF
jgi:hypothetical protein